jgi:dihydroflavonol-4-reductase
VPKTLLTGGAGLVGGHVVRLLAERGDDLRLTVRETSRLDNVADVEFEPAICDILDRRAVRRAMRDVDRVYHVAGSTSLRASAEQLHKTNVQGTRVVLEEALRAGVQRVVYTSSIAAIGPATRGSTADENSPFTAGVYGLPYVNSKREAEIEALRLAAAGLPVVIVNPAHVFGSGDLNRSSTEVVRRFLRREIPAYVDGAINIVDAEDVARGHLLAEERGTIGERYILGNRNFTLDRLFADLGRLSGVEPPSVKLPLPAALALAAGLERVMSHPPITTVEVRSASLWWAFRSTKAKRELGWAPSHHEDTLETTIAWYRERIPDELAPAGSRQPLPLRLGGFALRRAGALGRTLRP